MNKYTAMNAFSSQKRKNIAQFVNNFGPKSALKI